MKHKFFKNELIYVELLFSRIKEYYKEKIISLRNSHDNKIILVFYFPTKFLLYKLFAQIAVLFCSIIQSFDAKI